VSVVVDDELVVARPLVKSFLVVVVVTEELVVAV
jgi:hypothetical protein